MNNSRVIDIEWTAQVFKLLFPTALPLNPN